MDFAQEEAAIKVIQERFASTGTALYMTGYNWNRTGYMDCAPVDYPAWNIIETADGSKASFYRLVGWNYLPESLAERILLRILTKDGGERIFGRFMGWSVPVFDVPAEDFTSIPEEPQKDGYKSFVEAFAALAESVDERALGAYDEPALLFPVPSGVDLDVTHAVVRGFDGKFYVGKPEGIKILTAKRKR